MNNSNKIPKIIHYCWFGNNEMSELSLRCLESWKKHLPDYTFMKWNESKIDINQNEYIKEAYENKKFSFVADYTRVYALYNYGGIYLDLDVELKNPFDRFLTNSMFFSFEDSHHVSTAIIGSQKNHFFLKEILDYYNQAKFSLKTNVDLITQKLCQYGLVENNQYQTICHNEITVYPNDYFSPLKFGDEVPKITNNTVCVHLFEGTWQDTKIKRKLKIINVIKKILGNKLYYYILRRIKGLDYSPIILGIVSKNTDDNCDLVNIGSLKYYRQIFINKPNIDKKINILSNLKFVLTVFTKKINFIILFEDIDSNLLAFLRVIGIPVIRVNENQINEKSNSSFDYIYEGGKSHEFK